MALEAVGPPEHPTITIPRSLSGRTLNGLGGEVHRPKDWPAHVVTVRLIPCTDPLRTIVDMAGVTTPDELEEVLDRALAARLVTPAAVDAELTRVGQRGKPGTRSLRSALCWRIGAPSRQPSVLESMTLRLLLRAGIKPLATEVRAGPDLSYRVDVMLCAGLALEVDGYSYHQGAEQMAEDIRRRNRLHLSGTRVLVYTWRDIAYDGHRVVQEVRRAMGQQSRPGGPNLAVTDSETATDGTGAIDVAGAPDLLASSPPHRSLTEGLRGGVTANR
jgi:very-short-patch-repair endonuclease